MVPRPGSTTPKDGVVINGGAIDRWLMSSKRDLSRRVARREPSRQIMGPATNERATKNTPPGATTDIEESHCPPGLKPAKDEDHPSAPTRANFAKRKPKKKEKLHAPESEYALSRTEPFKKPERNPNIAFLKPKLIGEFTGPFHESEFAKLANERLSIQTPLTMLRESGFVLVSIRLGLGIMKERNLHHPRSSHPASRNDQAYDASEPRTRTPLSIPRYTSSEGLDSSVKCPKRMPMRCAPRVMQHTATSAEPEIRTQPGCKVYPDDANQNRGFLHELPNTAPQQTADIAMVSKGSYSSHRSKRDRDEDSDDLFDLDASPPGAATAILTATVGTGLARVRVSAFSELKEFIRRDASEDKARAWFNRLKSASRRDAMTGDEVYTLFGTRWPDPHVSAAHGAPILLVERNEHMLGKSL
ncbi:Eukaryotic/viral aspartic protease [Phytophthora megakarya]|uniref:Eukaryotic/viral aspartic protease n=1 Tax=Phytophthora megakarya TaxID=4795 RepID=A0A225VQN8_9STRA|nr:Eukaryotic/viral aspartic protease [Phytophthora megakarya]